MCQKWGFLGLFGPFRAPPGGAPPGPPILGQKWPFWALFEALWDPGEGSPEGFAPEETRVLTIKTFIALRSMIINVLGVDLELTRALLLTQKTIDLCGL